MKINYHLLTIFEYDQTQIKIQINNHPTTIDQNGNCWKLAPISAFILPRLKLQLIGLWTKNNSLLPSHNVLRHLEFKNCKNNIGLFLYIKNIISRTWFIFCHMLKKYWIYFKLLQITKLANFFIIVLWIESLSYFYHTHLFSYDLVSFIQATS